MKTSIPFVFLAVVLAASSWVRAGDQPDAAARAKAVAPFVNETTVVVGHVDVSRAPIGPTAARIARLVPDAKDQIEGVRAEAARHIEQFLQAGGKDVYFTVSLGDSGLLPTALAIIPLSASADENRVRAAMEIPATAGRRIGDALVIRLPPNDSRPIEIQSSPRAELTAAFEAAGDGTGQALLIPPSYSRRVVEELLPQLPKEMGGGPSSVLTQGISWAAARIDLPPQPALHLVVKARDADAAEALHGKWAEILRLAGQDKEVRGHLPQFEQIAALLSGKVDGDRLVLSLDGKTADKLLSALEMPLEKARSSAGRAQSMNNLKNLALAMFMYSDAHNHFPAAASSGPDGKPLLSWRVYILPFIAQEQLFNQFHLNEPWDSPHNKMLIEKMPAVFHSPRSKAEKGKTNYLAPVGNGALYASRRDEPQMKDIKDGASNTIMMIEVDDPHAVIWTKPDDFSFDPKDPKQGIGSAVESGFNAAFCDGSVRLLRSSIDAKTLSALFTRAGGELVGPY